jgi:tetratricopeptide (TPR) repeat protein
VISRTSVMRYKNSEKSLREIASELGVAHILEGSVQRAGDRVRITAQLIDAQTDAHLWAERYDRPLQDIFAVQSEIAQQIAQALQAELSSGERERLVRQPTTDPMAHDHVLRAREYLRLFTPSSTAAALSLLRSARELDPEYPDVYAALARAFHQRVVFSGGEELWDSSEVAARRAIALDPEFAPGYAQLGWILDFRGDREAALEAHLQAVQLNPNHADGLANLYHYSFGRLDEAARWWGPALRADPNNSFSVWLAGRTYQHLGMPARARPLLEKSIAITPDLVWYQYSLIMNFLLEGRREEARAQMQRMLAFSEGAAEALFLAGLAAADMEDFPAARSYFERYHERGGGRGQALEAQGMLTFAWILQQAGEAERARELVQKAARWLGGHHKLRAEAQMDLAKVRLLEGDREASLRQMEEAVRQGWRFYNENPHDPVLNSLRGDPRYDRLMAEVKEDVARQRARVEREGW